MHMLFLLKLKLWGTTQVPMIAVDIVMIGGRFFSKEMIVIYKIDFTINKNSERCRLLTIFCELFEKKRIFEAKNTMQGPIYINLTSHVIYQRSVLT